MKITNSSILVSVVIPVYNVEKFIAETIESVLDQSLNSIEVILVDDGSTDNSLLICEQFAKEDLRIKLIKQENSGVSSARNKGLEVAAGEYVFFMDSDDTIDSEFLKGSYEIAKNQDLDIVIIGEHCCRRLPNVFALPTMGQMLKCDFLNKYPDIRFPVNIQPCEDGLFSHQLLALTKRIGANPYGIYHYRQHENQNHKTNKENVERVLLQIPLWFKILDDFYKKYRLYESHSLHLALFMEHEPFQFRYLSMQWDANQKRQLHELIQKYTQKNILPFLSNENKKKLTVSFLSFVNCKNAVAFDNYYKRLKLQYKVRLFIAKIIPFSKIRRRMRIKVQEEIKLNII